MHTTLNGNTTPDLIFLLIFNLSLIFALVFVAPYINLIDHPGGRKTHPHPTPLVGGLAIYLTLLMAMAINNDWNSDIGMILIWAGAIICIGCLDDIKNVRWPIRLFVQVVATLGAVWTTGIKVNYLGTYPIVGIVELNSLSTYFTVFSVVSIVNAFNLIDGIDGLCAGILSIVTVALLIIYYLNFGIFDYYLSLLAVILVIFYMLNLSENPKRKIFLGDAGSTGIGFILSFIVIDNINYEPLSLAPPIALWFFLVPIMDTVSVILKRISTKKSIFEPNLDHLHHNLLKIGFSRRKVQTLLLLTALFGVVTGILLNQIVDIVSIVSFLIIYAYHSRAICYIKQLFKITNTDE